MATNDDAPRLAAEWLGRPLSTGKGQRGQPVGVATLPVWVDRVREEMPGLEQLRKLKVSDRERYDKAKEQAYWVILSGDYSEAGRRRRKDPCDASGLVFAELDGLSDGETPEQARDRLAQHSAVLGAWVSLGGDGVHMAVAVDPSPADFAEHKLAWDAVVAELGLPPKDNDKAVKNRNRLVYKSSDAMAYCAAPGDVVQPVDWRAHALTAASVTASVVEAVPDEARPVRREHRNPVELAIRFLSDHATALVVTTDGNEAVIYRCSEETGLLSDGYGGLGALLHETLSALCMDGMAVLPPKELPGYVTWLAGQNSLLGWQTLVKAAPAAIEVMRADPELALRLPELHHPRDMNSNRWFGRRAVVCWM